jgi:two-component system sensor histidine kinase KdpD
MIDVAVEREEAAERAADAEAARRADVARTAILHAISHDLRSPITAITTAAAALRSPELMAQERLELIVAIEAESSRLARLVGDLLDLSKIEAGALSPQADWCDVGDLAVSAARRFEGEHPIELRVPADLPLVRADAAQLERAFANLIENAVKFSEPGAAVQITGGAGPAWVTVRVVDHGPGIPLEQRRHIFEPFYRGRTGGAPGSGLGLAISRGFVEANGGRIVVQSNADLGTSFAVSFPRIPQPQRQQEPSALTPTGHH